ncbi:MAG: hypothetical protein ABI563_10360 [Specibacter sp.]
MSIGCGIDAILGFALTLQLDWVDIPLVGDIFMGAGVVAFVLGLIYTFRRRRSTSAR